MDIKKLKKLRPMIYKINLLLLIIFVLPLTNYSIKSLEKLSKSKLEEFENFPVFKKKIQILKTIYIPLVLLLSILILSTMGCRIIFYKNPIGTQPIQIITLNKNISNLIENLSVFFILFTFFIIDLEEKYFLRGLAIGYFYLIIRIFYSITYIIGAKIKYLQLRSTPFGFNIFLLLFLFLENFGYNAFDYLENKFGFF